MFGVAWKLMIAVGVFVVGGVCVSSYSFAQFGQMTQATVDVAIEGMGEQVPDGITDRSIKNKIANAEKRLIDAKVNFALVETQMKRVQVEISTIERRMEQTQSLLKAAYPCLRNAVQAKMAYVEFANLKYERSELESEIDQLIAKQERDQALAAMKGKSLDRLKMHHAQHADAIGVQEQMLADVRSRLDIAIERRKSAKVENEIIGQLGPDSFAIDGKGVLADIEDLEHEVEKMEARNQTVRESLNSEFENVVGQSQTGGQIVRDFNRLTRLERLVSIDDE